MVGNDAGWTQIAREQIEMLHDDVGTVLAHTDYHSVAEGFGAAGLRVDDPELVPDVLAAGPPARGVRQAGAGQRHPRQDRFSQGLDLDVIAMYYNASGFTQRAWRRCP